MTFLMGRVYDFSELADHDLADFTAGSRPIPKNRRPDPAFTQIVEKDAELL